MDYESMELEQLKEIAKEKGITFGKIGKEKLIDKIKEHDSLQAIVDENNEDDDLTPIEPKQSKEKSESKLKRQSEEEVLASINDAIDELEDSADDDYRVESVVVDMNKEIPCKSITYGGLIYVSSKTNIRYIWKQIGAITYIPMSDLVTMNNDCRAFLEDPLIILQDVDAIKYFRLNQVYENVAKVNNLKKVFASNDVAYIEKTLRAGIDANMTNVLISKITQMIKNGVLTNINVIKICSRVLDNNFEDLTDDL